MQMTDQQSSFEGWAILEIFGHQRYAGFVKTEVFGTASMFRLDVPALEERTRVTKRAGSVDGQWAPAGTTVKESATPGYSKLFGVGAIYCLTPCTQEAALAAVEEIQPRALMLVSLPEGKTLAAAAIEKAVDEAIANTDDSDMCLDCGKPLDYCRCA
jgi:hypothetical protein